MSNRQDIVEVPLAQAYRLMGFGPVIMVSTTDGSTPDASTVAWARPCAKEPPTFSLNVGTGHRTYKNLAKTGMLCINVPTREFVDTVMYCGRVSGNDVDKVREREIEIRYGNVLRDLPLLDDCVAWLECRVVPWTIERGTSMIRAEAVAASCVEGVLTEQYAWNVARFQTLHHLGGSQFMVSGDVLDMG